MQPDLQNPEVTCLNCGSINDYEIILKANQATAWCNGCGKFIKNVPYKAPALYFGKFKGRDIASMLAKDEVEYLQWLIAQTWCKSALKRQIDTHLNSI